MVSRRASDESYPARPCSLASPGTCVPSHGGVISITEPLLHQIHASSLHQALRSLLCTGYRVPRWPAVLHPSTGNFQDHRQRPTNPLAKCPFWPTLIFTKSCPLPRHTMNEISHLFIIHGVLTDLKAQQPLTNRPKERETPTPVLVVSCVDRLVRYYPLFPGG